MPWILFILVCLILALSHAQLTFYPVSHPSTLRLPRLLGWSACVGAALVAVHLSWALLFSAGDTLVEVLSYAAGVALCVFLLTCWVRDIVATPKRSDAITNAILNGDTCGTHPDYDLDP